MHRLSLPFVSSVIYMASRRAERQPLAVRHIAVDPPRKRTGFNVNSSVPESKANACWVLLTIDAKHSIRCSFAPASTTMRVSAAGWCIVVRVAACRCAAVNIACKRCDDYGSLGTFAYNDAGVSNTDFEPQKQQQQ